VTAVRDLEERVAVITGAGGEIGTAIATRLAARGAAIVVNHRDSSDAEAAQRTAAAARGAGSGLYSATKGAAEQLSLALAASLEQGGLTVNVVSPGPIDTAAFRHGKSEEVIDQLRRMSPLDRLGTPDDVAGVIGLLCQPAASWITGQNIRVNGGQA